MSFKKYLRMSSKKAQAPLEISKRPFLKHKFLTGQASLEYFILFAIIGGLTLISLSSFLPQVKQTGEGLFASAVARILNP